MKAGLRIDVDTHDGLAEGVPRLLEILGRAGVRGTFYVAMGPDNSGRAVFGALFRKGFLRKMFRTRAVSTYGLRTVLSGTLLPARPIGSGRPDLLRRIAEAGHELGPHSWDHRRWQDKLDRMSPAAVRDDIDRAAGALREATGGDVKTTAAPAWLSRDESLAHEETLDLSFASDCRGRAPFYPRSCGRDLATLQVPATLPTLDEMLGAGSETPAEYYGEIASRLDAAEKVAGDAAAEVLTIHAETEGRGQAQEFERFLDDTRASTRWVPLGELADAARRSAPRCEMIRASVPGRHGEASMQGPDIAAPVDGEKT